MSRFQSTVMPDLKDSADTVGVRKMGVDLLRKINEIYDVLTGAVDNTNAQFNTYGVYDTGSNANGSWIRYGNGVMQCWGNIPLSAAGFTVTLPQAFSVTSYRTFCQLVGNVPAIADDSVITAKTTTTFSGSFLRNEFPNTLDWMAMGTWK